MQSVLEMNGGDVCPTRWMYVMPRLVHLKTVNMVNSVLYIFYHNKKIIFLPRNMSRPWPGKGAWWRVREKDQGWGGGQ